MGHYQRLWIVGRLAPGRCLGGGQGIANSGGVG